jgi:hypothetical protein
VIIRFRRLLSFLPDWMLSQQGGSARSPGVGPWREAALARLHEMLVRIARLAPPAPHSQFSHANHSYPNTAGLGKGASVTIPCYPAPRPLGYGIRTGIRLQGLWPPTGANRDVRRLKGRRAQGAAFWCWSYSRTVCLACRTVGV